MTLFTLSFLLSALFTTSSSNLVASRGLEPVAINALPQKYEETPQKYEGMLQKYEGMLQKYEGTPQKYDGTPQKYEGTCSCLNYSCGCCQRIYFPKVNLNDTACLNLRYVVSDIGLEFTLVWDNKTIFKASASVKNPPPICFAVPELKNIASICIKFYNLTRNGSSVSGCAKLVIKLVYTTVEDVEIGCFQIPPGDQLESLTTTTANKKPSQMTQKEKVKFLQKLGLMSKTYGDGRLNNYIVGYQ